MGWFDRPRLTRLVPIHRAADAIADVIFVHGLDGEATATWRFDATPSWHSWITAAQPNVNIWSLDYRLRSSGWFGGSMPLTDRAVNVLATIDVELTGERPILFVCHSYGGLLVKQLLRSARETATDYAALMTGWRGSCSSPPRTADRASPAMSARWAGWPVPARRSASYGAMPRCCAT